MRNSIQWTRGTVQRFWARVPLREKGLFAAGLPMLAVIFSATMAFFGNEERERTEAAVRRHFSMIENLADLQAHLLDAETGLRGHLLAHESKFLQPYELARRSLSELEALRQLVEGEPGVTPRQQKLVRLGQIRETVQREMTLLEGLRAFTRDEAGLSGGVLNPQLEQSKLIMTSSAPKYARCATTKSSC